MARVELESCQWSMPVPPAAAARRQPDRAYPRHPHPVVIGLEKPVRAMEITEPGGPEVVRFAERDEPAPGPGQVTIRVEYAGLNFVEVLPRRGVSRSFTRGPLAPRG